MKIKAKNAPRCATGISGLDDILHGGLPRNRLYLLQGEPGVGKTTLAMQFLLEGTRLGEAGLYVTLSETKEELEEVAASHGWNLKRIHLFELSAMEEQIKGGNDSTFFHPSEVELNKTTQLLLDQVLKSGAQRVVFDSLSELRLLAETPLRYRRQILHLKQFFAGRKCTVLLLDDRSDTGKDLQVESIAHGVISLERSSPGYGIARRQLTIQKIRGAKFREGNHDLILEQGGLRVFPRLIAAEHQGKYKRESFPSGIKELDALLGGGLDRGTSTMFMGPPGTGKSTLAIKFAHALAEKGESTLMFLFDETVTTMTARVSALGMDLEPHLKSGRIKVMPVDPAEISPGELTHRIRDAVEADKVRMVVIDSINGYLNAMPAERYLNLQLHELLAYLSHKGVISIMVLAQQGMVGTMQSAVDLTYLSDTVVLMRYFEARGALKQAISVVKKRSGNHERTIREITVAEGRLRIGEPLTDMQGVLTGVPSFFDNKSQTDKQPK